ncbi:MAG TPA: VOC family protein, partial [Acidobacteriaceae bacterium]|nr:VOC family protein [Acidobacteriaceae bacterium]
RATVIPVLAYPNAPEAATWLCRAFGFTVRLRVDTHRVQLNVGADGAVIVREPRPYEHDAPLGLGHNLTVRVGDADVHCTHARAHGAKIVDEPTTHPYGERQYVAEDPAGHLWTFSQSVEDLHPDAWGGTAEQL